MIRFTPLLLLATAVAFAPSSSRTRRAVSLHMGKVVVELDKVTGLQDEDAVGTSDPYVRYDIVSLSLNDH